MRIIGGGRSSYHRIFFTFRGLGQSTQVAHALDRAGNIIGVKSSRDRGRCSIPAITLLCKRIDAFLLRSYRRGSVFGTAVRVLGLAVQLFNVLLRLGELIFKSFDLFTLGGHALGDVRHTLNEAGEVFRILRLRGAFLLLLGRNLLGHSGWRKDYDWNRAQGKCSDRTRKATTRHGYPRNLEKVNS